MTPDKIKTWIDNFKDQRDNRIKRFSNNIDFLRKEEQWDDEDIEAEQIVNEDERLVINQVDEFLEFYLAKLFPRDPLTNAITIGVNVKDLPDSQVDEYEKLILSTYKSVRLIRKLLEQGQNFLVGGNGCFYYPYDSGIRQTRLFSIDPLAVYGPEFDDHDIQAIAFEERISESTKKTFFTQVLERIKMREEETVTKITYWDKNQKVVLENGEVVEREKNTLGYIPFTWLENRPNSHTHEGNPEVLESDRNLQKEYNKRFSNFGQRAKKNTRAKLAIFSQRELAKNITKKDGNDILTLDPSDKAEFLNYQENAEVLSYLDKIDNHMKRKRGMNDATDGVIKTHVSGISMSYSFAPLLDRIGLRRVSFDQFFEEFNKAILINKFKEKASNVITEPVYNPILAPDYDQKVTNVLAMRDRDIPLISLDRALDILHGAENAAKEKEKIMNELDEIEKRRQRLGVIGGSPPMGRTSKDNNYKQDNKLA